MKTLMLFAAMFSAANLSARAQGTLIYDQQATAGARPFTCETISQTNQSLGQSFIPTLSSLDSIQLYLSVLSQDTTIYMNLWSGSISNGVLLASSLPVFIPSGTDSGIVVTSPIPPPFPYGVFYGAANFFFSTSVVLTPGATYYFQPVVETGGLVRIGNILNLHGHDAYPSGTGFLNGMLGAWDLWFAEGVVAAPEPSAGWLILMGVISFYWIGRKRVLR